MTNADKKLWTFHQIDNVENLISGHLRQDLLCRKIYKTMKKGRILEIGFGDGYLLRKLVNKYKCCGVDISEENVSQMQKNIPNVKFNLIGTDGKLPYEDNYFDGFVASEVFEHMDEDELIMCIAEMQRILRPGGHIFITVPAEEDLRENECFCPNCNFKFHKWGHKQTWTREKINKDFNEFNKISIRRIIFSNPGLNIFGKIGNVFRKILSKFIDMSGETFLIVAKKTEFAKSFTHKSSKEKGSDKLSEKEHWDNNYRKNVFLPVKQEINSVDSFSLNEIFNKYINVKNGDSFIELGCAPGGWLYYFSKYFNLKVAGIDYSKEGIDITRENMNILDIKALIIRGDILQYKIEEKYDVVFSAGLMEHFHGEKLKEIIKKHFDFVKIGGYVIIMIPNLSGWNYFYQKLINKKNIDIHNLKIMNLDFFEKNINICKTEKMFLGYAGKINFGLFSGNKFFSYLHTFMQIIVNVLFFKLGLKFKENKNTSPYILAIYKVIEK